jgi:methionyl-tRNA synthetase
VPAQGSLGPLETELYARANEMLSHALEAWEHGESHRALEWTWSIASAANQYVDRAAPWAEHKHGRGDRVATILHTLLTVLGALARLAWPAIPSRSDEMLRQLGLPALDPRVGTDLLVAPFEPRREGEPLDPGSALFPTFDADEAKALVSAVTPSAPAPVIPPEATSTDSGNAATPSIGYDQFMTVDLRVGIVREAARVPRKDKLLRLSIDLGEPELRPLVAGLALTFKPEDLVGRRVVVVANLAPRDFGKGIVSHGMLLATGPSEALVLATVAGDAPAGARLK